MTSDGKVLLRAATERRIGTAAQPVALIADPWLVTHSLDAIPRARRPAIASDR